MPIITTAILTRLENNERTKLAAVGTGRRSSIEREDVVAVLKAIFADWIQIRRGCGGASANFEVASLGLYDFYWVVAVDVAAPPAA